MKKGVWRLLKRLDLISDINYIMIGIVAGLIIGRMFENCVGILLSMGVILIIGSMIFYNLTRKRLQKLCEKNL